MNSAITSQGMIRFEFHDGATSAQLFIDFMTALIHDAKRELFLILHNLRGHQVILVKEWLNGHKEDIQIFCLPRDSPQTTPD